MKLLKSNNLSLIYIFECAENRINRIKEDGLKREKLGHWQQQRQQPVDGKKHIQSMFLS